MNCLNCGKETKNPKYCSSSCSAKITNKSHPKRQFEGKCVTCEASIKKQLKYCEDCFNEYLKNIQENMKCTICEVYKNEENSRPQGGGRKSFQSYCKQCTAGVLLLRGREFKKKCVDYKGGCCQHCGYNQCYSSLDFHHLNPEEKDFAIASVGRYLFDDKIKLELDKCILLCANCHREEHNNIIDLKYKDFFLNYLDYKNKKNGT